MAVYMLGFNTYMGFGDKIRGELGENKDITKIECEDNFDYNYKDGVSFNIYLCSD